MKRVRDIQKIDKEIDSLLQKRARMTEEIKNDLLCLSPNSNSDTLESSEFFSSLDSETRECLTQNLPVSLDQFGENYKLKRSWKVKDTAEYRVPKIAIDQSFPDRLEKKMCLAMRKTKGGYRFVYHKGDKKCAEGSLFCLEHQQEVYKKNLLAQKEAARERNIPEAKSWKKLEIK